MGADRFVRAPGGSLFVRVWGTIGSSTGRSAIILFHDSLGCVELWREFPSQLASTTGLPVVAYDRLGFGRSDPHPGRLKFGFVEDETRTAVPELRSALGIERMVLFGHSVGGRHGCGYSSSILRREPGAGNGVGPGIRGRPNHRRHSRGPEDVQCARPDGATRPLPWGQSSLGCRCVDRDMACSAVRNVESRR